ncbi:MAG: YraN family protein [bacterium]|nr:YraN family protein [bacterium]
MALHNIIGKEGEEIARKYLKGKGYIILEENYQTKRAEIDIIARLRHGFLGQGKDILVFVEVRTKCSEQFGTPEETIYYQKRMKLKRNAAAYVYRKKYYGAYRIDAVCLVIDEHMGLKRINHYENIVET